MSQQKNSATGTFTGKSDVFLRIQTRRAGLIKGESVDPKHLDEIQVSSWHWGLSSPTAIGTTHATGRRSYTGLTINKFIDASTTALMSVLATNDEVKEAKLAVRKSGGTQEDYFIITLNAARVISVTHGVDAAGMAAETVVINFTKVAVEYRLQGQAGGLAAATSFNDDIGTPT